MMLSWLFYTLVVSAVISASALAFEVAARALGVARRLAWSAALGAIVVLPLLLPALARAFGEAASAPVSGAGFRLPAIMITGTPAAEPLATDGMIIATLLAAAALGIVVLAVAHARLARAARQWRVAEVDGIGVRVSAGVGPAVFGWWRPVIVVPEWICALGVEERQMILAHEQEHARAGDSLLLNSARVALAIAPWNPLAWLAYRRLQLAVECDCDRRVLAKGRDALAYADTLLDVVRRSGGRAASLRVALTEPSSFLSRRISAMLSQNFRSPRLIAAGSGAAGLLLFAVACMTREPVAAAAPSQPRVHQVPEVVVTAVEPSAATPAPGGFVEFTIDEPAMPLPGARPPRYPDSLRVAKIEGEVLAQFVVNADGTPDVSSFKVLRATHPAFVVAVKEALPSMAFSAARVKGRAVRQLIQQPYSFSLAK